MRRAFALLQAVWLALLIAEPAALHACEMHASGHASHAVSHAAEPAAQEHVHDGSGAQETMATPVPSAPASDFSEHCQCLGECCAAATATLASPPAIPAVALIAAVETRHAVTRDVATRAADLKLPHATAPPVALTI